MEKELIKRAKNNDLSAFEELIKMHEKTVYNIALKVMGNQHDASDAAQEAFIKMFKNIKKFRGDSKFSTWVYRIAHNVALDMLRKNSKKTVSIDENYEDGENPILNIADPSPSPEQSVIDKEKMQILKNAIDSLPTVSKTAIMLRDINGLSYEEIAKIQNCSLGTVKSRINRARIQLKEIIMKQNY